MKRLVGLMTGLLVISTLLLSACTGASAPGQGTCREGVCVRLLVAEPVLLNAPTVISVIVLTEEAIPGLEIYMAPSEPGVLVEGDRKWTLDTLVSQNITVSSTWRFTQEGYFFVLAQAFDSRRGMVVGDSVRIHITRTGGIVYYSGTPLPLTPGLGPTAVRGFPPTPTRAPYP